MASPPSSGAAPTPEASTCRISPFAACIITKPVIAVVIGGVVYLIAVSGNLVFNSQTKIENPQILDLLAFLAGFSDKFSSTLFNAVMSNSAVGRSGEPEPATPARATARQRGRTGEGAEPPPGGGRRGR